MTSLQHPLVKKLVKLRESRDARKNEGTALVVGQTVVREIAAVRKIKTLISVEPLALDAEESLLATKPVLEKIIGHKTDDLVAAEVVLPPPAVFKTADLVVLLDGISDPGNIGTIFRTALALGWDAAFVIQGSADPYNDKAMRASRAASLLLPWREGGWDAADRLIRESKRHVFVADTQGTPLSQVKFSRPLVLVLGHETRGPSEKARSLGTTISIPMRGDMESLNVASAASIFLYQIPEVLK